MAAAAAAFFSLQSPDRTVTVLKLPAALSSVYLESLLGNSVYRDWTSSIWPVTYSSVLTKVSTVVVVVVVVVVNYEGSTRGRVKTNTRLVYPSDSCNGK